MYNENIDREALLDRQNDHILAMSLLHTNDEFTVSPVESTKKALTLAGSIDEMTLRGRAILTRADLPPYLATEVIEVGGNQAFSNVLALYKEAAQAVRGLRKARELGVHAIGARGLRSVSSARPTEAGRPVAVVTDPTLPLGGSFAPSKQLVQFWVRGNAEAMRAAGRGPEADVASGTRIDHSLQHEFARLVTVTLATIAQQLRAAGARDAPITKSGRFTFSVQTTLCDRILVVPDESTPFLTLLSSELRGSIAKGASVEGRWGQIVVEPRSGDLSFALVPAERLRDPAFTKAVEIE